MVRRYRSTGIYGGRVREHSGRRIDRDTRTARERTQAEAAWDAWYAEAMAEAAANPRPRTQDDDDEPPF